MRDIRAELIDMLKAEVKPAVGCTEPVALALACAKAKELLGEEVLENEMLVSPNIYKNGMGVGIPGSKRAGLKIAAAMGIIGGHSENGLSVLETLTSEEVEESETYMDNNPISVSPADTKEKVFIQVILKGKEHSAKVKIRTKHDNFTFLERDGEVLLNNEVDRKIQATSTDTEVKLMDTVTIKELIENVEKIDFKDIEFLLDGVKMNEEMASIGLDQKVGIGVGYGIKKSIEEGLLNDDLINHAMMLTAGASDARMAGIKMPVMSSNGSGNHGLTAILPIVAYNDKFPQTDEKLARALAISHLVTGFIKNFTGRLSAVCGCGVAASTGAAAGLSWLMDSTQDQIEGAIENMIADLSGMICDGAKPGCALKLSSAASAAMQSAIIAKQDCLVPSQNGIVGSTVEESIKNLGRVSDKGMSVTDEVILNVMDDMNKVK
ncbi:L-serine ammonia-lyase, iron-sulfur-dependent, subunit alpha [Clostridioides mangenotii]|uniref:L-cysteine desulfidase family protein n=1 Tax=Metaclostridioides mangenotii TaxID=1540 RepID=UPI00214A1E1B|nr:L-serine ammonia-lyase, iron-sulfur-dependent, subunit alpha [Clostridioides mangenotii]MCR1953914.1 L-serine ammonia-lyase, iron-sulfur-dependent, subunit alpha [Clostridioides mangenotii]